MEKSSKLKRELKREAGEGDDKNDRLMAENLSDADESPDTKQSKRSPLKKVSINHHFRQSCRVFKSKC